MDFRAKLASAQTEADLYDALVAEVLHELPDASIHLMPLNPVPSAEVRSLVHLRDRNPEGQHEKLAAAVNALNTELPIPNLFEQPDHIVRVERCVGWKPWLRSTVYQQHFRPLDSARQLVLGMVDSAGAPRAFIAICRGERDKDFGDDDVRQIRQLCDQTQLSLGDFLVSNDWANPADEILEALEVSLPIPAILVETSGRILWMNREAELRLGLVAFAVGSSKAYGGHASGIDALIARAQRELDRPGASLAHGSDMPSWLRPGETMVVRPLSANDSSKRALVCLIPTPIPPIEPAHALNGHKLGLTARQFEIAELAARGFSVTNIAARLGISESTVKTHLKHIYQKLGVCSRAELAWRLSRSSL